VKITQLTRDTETIWEDFLSFCIKSKPYDYHQIGSLRLKQAKIRKNFEDLVSSCQVFVATNNKKKVVVAFLKAYDTFIDVEFIFGFRQSFNSAVIISAVHEIFSYASILNNKKYFKSQIRRKFKVNSYKKWIERYDNKAIIFNDKDDTIIWCNLNKMKMKFKVIGSNSAMDHLVGEIGYLGKTYDYEPNSKIIREIFFGEEKHLLDEKTIEFTSEYVFVHGFLSNDKDKVGRVTLRFEPQQKEEKV
jgi:hypothetical protein